MNQAFYIGATAALEQQRRMDIQGNNIANVNTHGFRAERARFSNLMNDYTRAVEEEIQPFGLGARLQMSTTDFRNGTTAATRRPLDFMIQGEGFFAIKNLESGEVTFTRNGAFYASQLSGNINQVDESGAAVTADRMYLSDGEGNFVLGPTGRMIEVRNDQLMQPLGVFDFDNRVGLRHVDGTCFQANEEYGPLKMGTGEIKNGALELSNVDLAEEISKVIESQRAYSMALKIVQTNDEVETTINGLRG